MRTIRAVFDGRVFVPEEEVHLEKGVKATITLEKRHQQSSKEEWRPPTAEDRERYRQELQAYIDEHLPDHDLKVPDWLVNMVGIAPPMTDEEIKEEYHMHFLETDG